MRKYNITKSTDSRYRSPWHVRFRKDGRQQRRCFEKRDLAERFIESEIALLHAGEFSEVVGIPWEQLTDEFLAAKIGDQLRDATLTEYIQAFDDFAQANNDPVSSRISDQSVDQFKRAVGQNKPATVNKKLRHLCAIFNWAVSRLYLKANPITRGSRLRETKRVYHIMTQDELKKVIEACPNDQWRLMIQLALHGAGRKHDLKTLKIEAIDLDAGIIKVLRAKQHAESETPLHPNTLRELANYISEIPAGQKSLFTIYFAHNSWKAILKRAGVTYSRFHDLRTSMSSWMKAAGVSSDIPAKIFGHSNPSITYHHYTQFEFEVLRDAINRLPL